MRRMKKREGDLNAGIGFIDLFVQVSLDDAIVVQPKPFADGILGDLQTAVEVAS